MTEFQMLSAVRSINASSLLATSPDRRPLRTSKVDIVLLRRLLLRNLMFRPTDLILWLRVLMTMR